MLSEASDLLEIIISPGKAKAPGKSSGKGTTMSIFTTHNGRTDEHVSIQMPRAVTFGVRQPKSSMNLGTSLNYGVALKYRMDQTETAVEPLRKIHEQIKNYIAREKFQEILPNTCAQILKKLSTKYAWFPKDLFGIEKAKRDPKAVALFEETAAEKVDEICIFGGSEESAKAENGKSKMVSFSGEKPNNDGGVYDKSWMINLKAPIATDKKGVQLMHDAPKEETMVPGTAYTPVPQFTFSVCSGPENDLTKSEDIANINMIRKVVVNPKAPDAEVLVFGPDPLTTPFSREGVAVISLRFIHIRDDESQISVNMTLEHFHTYSRDAPILGKRKFVVKHDKDTPQIPEPVLGAFAVESDGDVSDDVSDA